MVQLIIELVYKKKEITSSTEGGPCASAFPGEIATDFPGLHFESEFVFSTAGC